MGDHAIGVAEHQAEGAFDPGRPLEEHTLRFRAPERPPELDELDVTPDGPRESAQ
jgi:hypothetical protein